MTSPVYDLDKYRNVATERDFFKKQGKIANAVGLTIESYGPDAKLGDMCKIYAKDGKTSLALAEVVGFKEGRTLLMPYGQVEGIGIGCIVENENHPLEVYCSDDLLGLCLDGLGNPPEGVTVNGVAYSIESAPPDPMSRAIIDEVLPLGVRAVDGLLTIGKGQRIGIFAGSGVGKSTLLGMFARNTKADINVIALIGERGREVREFVERDLGPEGMKRSVLVNRHLPRCWQVYLCQNQERSLLIQWILMRKIFQRSVRNWVLSSRILITSLLVQL